MSRSSVLLPSPLRPTRPVRPAGKVTLRWSRTAVPSGQVKVRSVQTTAEGWVMRSPGGVSMAGHRDTARAVSDLRTPRTGLRAVGNGTSPTLRRRCHLIPLWLLVGNLLLGGRSDEGARALRPGQPRARPRPGRVLARVRAEGAVLPHHRAHARRAAP